MTVSLPNGAIGANVCKGELPTDGALPEPQWIGVDMAATDDEATAIEPDSVDLGTVGEAAPVADWHIRQAAIHTAAQFQALAGKVEQCGFSGFADELRGVAFNLRNGDLDAALAKADREALIAADTLLLDATVECIDCLSEQQAAA